MKILISFFVLLSFAFSMRNSKEVNQKKRFPIVISLNIVNKNIEDTLTNFAQAYLRKSKIEVISFETALSLYNAELRSPQVIAIAQDDADRGEYSQKTNKKINKYIGTIANTIYFKLKADTVAQTVDSIYWNVNYIPMDMDRKAITHSFAPQNKSVYHALKEMCDSIIASKDVL